MKWDDKYKNPIPLESYDCGLSYDEVIYGRGKPEPCDQCKEPTHWLSLAFEAPLCSEECLKELWNEMLSL